MKISTKIGLIISSQGSTIKTAHQILIKNNIQFDFVVITDRKCGIEDWVQKNNIIHHQIEYTSNIDFSIQAFKIFKKHSCKNILLFYSRIITTPLIEDLHVYNIHPTILPSFKGVSGFRESTNHGSKFIGATLHKVNEEIDSGEILAQIVTPILYEDTFEDLQRVSHFQKVYLTLLFLEKKELWNKEILSFTSHAREYLANPKIYDKNLLSSLQDFKLEIIH